MEKEQVTSSEIGQDQQRKYQRWLATELAGLCVLMAIVWGLLMLPIIFYYLPVDNIAAANGSNCSYNGTTNCSEDFFFESDIEICVPMCSSWKQETQTVSTLIDVIVLMSYTPGFIASVAILIIAAFRYKTIFSFPNAIVVYMAAVYVINSLMYIITFFDRAGLYCSSNNLLEALGHVTPFCVISGIIQVYSTLSICLWWFMLTAALFWKIWFPINARMCETRRQIKYIHITCVLIGTLVPLIPVISLMSIFADNSSSHSDFLDGGLGFSFTRSPPLPCYGSDLAVTFYTTIFPSNILLAIGITFIFLIFWRVHKSYFLHKASQHKHPFNISTAERKLVLLLIHYVSLAVVGLTSFTESARKSAVFGVKIEEYFTCESCGYNPADPCNREQIEQFRSKVLIILGDILSGTLPLANLIFVISFQDLKNACSRVRATRDMITRSIVMRDLA